MNLPVLPPGTILQQMYLKERLKLLNPGKFIEIGCGQGILSYLLLKLGWQGIGYDLNPQSLSKAFDLNKKAIQLGKYELINENWLESNYQYGDKVDLIISCMVLEHLNEQEEEHYFKQCKHFLKDNGMIILFVPSCPDYWGIEDEIAGHYRRYTFRALKQKLANFGYDLKHIAGLTYPLSNILYPISEFLVKRAEQKKKTMTMLEKTKQSGNRNVLFKTTFPPLLKLILNDLVMYPFYLLQKANLKNDKALVIYLEAQP